MLERMPAVGPDGAGCGSHLINVARGGITWWRRGHHVAKRLRGKRKARGPTVGERQRLVESVVVGRVGDREARRELSHMKRDLRGVNVERLFTFHELFG